MEFHFQSPLPPQHQQSQDQQHCHHVSKAIKAPKFKGKKQKVASSGTTVVATKFVGVRQRPSGRWVAEIKDTTQKIRMWLGTFETAEEAAHAYDEAACLLRGANTRTNFSVNPNASAASNSPLALRIRNLLNSRRNKQPNKSNQHTLPLSNTSSGTMVAEDKINQAIGSLEGASSGLAGRPQFGIVQNSGSEIELNPFPTEMPQVMGSGIDQALYGSSINQMLVQESSANVGVERQMGTPMYSIGGSGGGGGGEYCEGMSATHDVPKGTLCLPEGALCWDLYSQLFSCQS